MPRESLYADLAAIQAFLDAELAQAIDSRAQTLDRLQAVLARPSSWANKQQHNLSQCSSRLGRAGQQVLNRQAMALEPQALRLTRAVLDMPAQMGQRLSRAALLLGSLDPALVLQRGYAWLENMQGQAIVSVQEVKVGEKVHARMADGVADMQVLGTHID
jgi:exodeoxyribonuclease VII large subunit